MSVLPRVGAALLALALSSTATAQTQEYRPPRIELDGVVGYTLVSFEKWSGFAEVEDSNPLSYGLVGRFIFLNFSGARLGLDVGVQQFFDYAIQGTGGTVIVTRNVKVDGFHFAPIIRVAESERATFDVGFGFFFLGDQTAAGLIVNGSRTLITRPGYSIPVGIRANLLLNEPASALNVALKAGISIPLGQ